MQRPEHSHACLNLESFRETSEVPDSAGCCSAPSNGYWKFINVLHELPRCEALRLVVQVENVDELEGEIHSFCDGWHGYGSPFQDCEHLIWLCPCSTKQQNIGLGFAGWLL